MKKTTDLIAELDEESTVAIGISELLTVFDDMEDLEGVQNGFWLVSKLASENAARISRLTSELEQSVTQSEK